MRRDERADMGIGAMVIFIAMVLVATVAASVLISTANDLKEQAIRTGTDATASVSTGFELIYITGDVSDNEVTELHLFMRLASGSQDIDVTRVVLSISISSEGGSIGADLVCDATNTVIVDDRVEFVISGMSASPGSSVNILVIPPAGYSTRIALSIPSVLTPGTMILR
ncbi:MAG: hypothetical protein ISF22_02175 [Methanomassiliicoccus sp.]|nr:hypothetical protein [Methanomassiliicoccus sp.]